jgi:hypothetical protein
MILKIDILKRFKKKMYNLFYPFETFNTNLKL